jgi:pyruvate/oxaloacetate carboxyltransferase
MMDKKAVKIRDTILRDASQSKIAIRIISPGHTVDLTVDKARQLEDLGADGAD